MENWKQVARGGLQGRSLRILRLHATKPFLRLHRLQDTHTGQLVEGNQVLQVDGKECTKKYPKHFTTMPSEWVDQLARSQVPQDGNSRVERMADSIPKNDQGTLSGATIIHRKAELNNKTAGVDGVVPALVKLFSMRSVTYLRSSSTWSVRSGPMRRSRCCT